MVFPWHNIHTHDKFFGLCCQNIVTLQTLSEATQKQMHMLFYELWLSFGLCVHCGYSLQWTLVWF